MILPYSNREPTTGNVIRGGFVNTDFIVHVEEVLHTNEPTTHVRVHLLGGAKVSCVDDDARRLLDWCAAQAITCANVPAKLELVQDQTQPLRRPERGKALAETTKGA